MTTPDELEALAASIRMFWPYPSQENLKRALDCVEREAARLRAEQAVLSEPEVAAKLGQCTVALHECDVQAPKPEGSGAEGMVTITEVIRMPLEDGTGGEHFVRLSAEAIAQARRDALTSVAEELEEDARSLDCADNPYATPSQHTLDEFADRLRNKASELRARAAEVKP